MTVRSKPDFISGLVFMGVGIAFAAVSRNYDMGGGKEIGPGYFPFLLGSALALLGFIVTLKSILKRTAEAPSSAWVWRPILWICVSIVVFALALPKLGLLAAIALMAGTSLFASDEKRGWLESALLIAVLLAFAYFVFVVGLRLQFQVLPSFLNLS